MASRSSARPLANDMYPYIQVGDKVARLFHSHELKGGLPEQWINGKVSGTKFNPKKGQRMQQPTWWSVTFDPPASTLLCCNSEEVEQMRQQWEVLRVKKATLQEQVGQELRVEWTDEDRDLSFSDWDGDLRVCVITKYLAAQEQFVLRFMCGYERVVEANTLVQLVADSDGYMASKKHKTKKSLAAANKEWAEYLACLGIKTAKDTRVAVAAPEPCEDDVLSELSAQVAAAKKIREEKQLAEDEARARLANRSTQQRADVARMQHEEAQAAVMATAYAEQKRKETADNAAAELLRTETANAAAAQARLDAEIAETLRKETADAAAAEQLRKEKASAAEENEARQGIIRGSYPKQDLFKTMDFLRSSGMGQGWCTNLVLPDELPTFYVDDPREHTGPGHRAHPPPPPSNSKPQEDLLAYVQVMVQKEMAKQQQEMRMPPTKKRKRAARRKPVKVEKVETE